MTEKLTVLYNDTCPICAREVAAYRRVTAARGAPVDYVGLSEGREGAFGLSCDAAARRLHVLRGAERLDGVAAFAALWEHIPRLRWLARVVRWPVVRPLAGWLYEHLAAPALYRLHKRRERLGKARRIG